MELGTWTTIETSRGCPRKCEFCSIWRFNKGLYRCKSPRRVVDEIHSLGEDDFAFIIDDNFFANIGRADAIANLIKEEKAQKKFVIQALPETIVRHRDTIERWADIDLWGLWLGFESISEGGMKALGADKSTKLNAQAVDILNDLGIKVFGSLIISPDFARHDFKRLRESIDAMRIALLNFYILTPYPGSELFTRMNMKYDFEEYALFDGFHAVLPTRLPLKEFYREYARLFFDFWSRNDESLLKSVSLRNAAHWYKQLVRLYEDHPLQSIGQ
jgi:radical SAM superfamily enzyme YgiQ (UPF0313 family)